MRPERWRQIDGLYLTARDLDPDRRVAFLAQACGEDAELIAKVQSMLDLDGAEDQILDLPAAGLLAESQEAPITTGTALGPYKVEALLGAGGMGQVFEAVDTRLGRKVAIKVAHEQFSGRFSREAQAIATLNHPHICALYDLGPNYLVMELVEGETLAAKLKKGSLSIEQTLRYGAQIAEALAEAHAKGIVHRDLKPANIMIAKTGAKVLDFGLAKSAEDASVTDSMARMGTPAYMAPEQIEGKPASARSDIYALGLALYEMATGKRPSQPLALEGLSDRFGHIVERCLAQEPESRWQTASDVKAELEWAAKTPPAATVAKPGRRWPWVAMAGAILLGGLGIWAFAQMDSSTRNSFPYRLQVELPGNSNLSTGSGTALAVSPDGRSIAYVISVEGERGVWVQALEEGAARRMRGTSGAQFVMWSPDGKSLAFRTENRLFRLDLASDTPVQICEVPPGPLFGGDWADDEGILLGTTRGIMRVAGSGGTLTTLVANGMFPRALPSRRFLYSSPREGGVFVASLDHPDQIVEVSKEVSRAIYASGPDGRSYLVWNRGTTLVAQEFDLATLKLTGTPRAIADSARDVAVSPAGLLLYNPAAASNQLAWVDRTGTLVSRIGDPGDFGFTRLSPDGSRVMATQGLNWGANPLWVTETQRGVSNPFTFSPGSHLSPVWSPDGKIVVFTTSTGLFRKPTNRAADEERIMTPSRLSYPTDWSPDGRTILYNELSQASDMQIWKLRATPDGRVTADPTLYIGGPFAHEDGRFSPNGKWVAYQSDESGKYEIYVTTFPEPNGGRQVSSGGGFGARWNPDGTELFYRSLDGKLMAVTLRLDKTPAAVSAPRALFTLLVNPGPARGANYDVSPDGKRFLVVVPAAQTPPPLRVILNWPLLMQNAPRK